MNNKSSPIEYDFQELVSVIKNSIREIVIFGFLGLIISVIYAYSLKPSFEARAVLKLPYISSVNPTSTGMKPLLEQQDFKGMISIAGGISSEISTECGLSIADSKVEAFDRIYRISWVPSATKTLVEISTTSASANNARDCLEAGIRYIAVNYDEALKQHISELNTKLDQSKACVDSVVNSQNPKSDVNILYLAFNSARLNKCADEMGMLTNIINMNKTLKITFLKSTYVIQSPSKPSKRGVYTAGALIGILVGMVVGLMRLKRKQAKDLTHVV